MAQLLESTRNFLKTSTRIGRRLSQYKEETSGSQPSLHINHNDTISPSNVIILADNKTQDTATHRPAYKKRISGLFTLDSRNKTLLSEERQVANMVSRKISPDSQETSVLPEERGRDTKSSERTQRSRKNRKDTNESANSSPYQDQDHSSEHMENNVPRGRSPALSLSNSISTAASSYDTRPSDYPSIRHYQAHVWRRNLLEESIMHSLKIGYAERHKPSRQHARPSKKDTPRARLAREQAILAAATGKELLPSPLSGLDSEKQESQENIIDRSLKIINSDHHTPVPSRPSRQQQPHLRHRKNSPYQLDHNASMSNITHSVASFTFELPEQHASHVMRSSVVPDLFMVKADIPPGAAPSHRTGNRRDSRASHVGGVAPSPRVLTGRKPTSPVQLIVLPNLRDNDEESESPLTPSSGLWADSVVASLNDLGEEKPNMSMEDPPGSSEAAPMRAT
ncbi:hypothetical protein BGZ65_005916 [Modicella reniformis]|uniref:Uncharacterized protein n=1 Tax=Modicella reniformis TaxID=1440133 RepID=A0A9P6LY77_9FUNG|nr:hypothetical protein BGZ65_005916 [Modicella reniformis]